MPSRTADTELAGDTSCAAGETIVGKVGLGSGIGPAFLVLSGPVRMVGSFGGSVTTGPTTGGSEGPSTVGSECGVDRTHGELLPPTIDCGTLRSLLSRRRTRLIDSRFPSAATVAAICTGPQTQGTDGTTGVLNVGSEGSDLGAGSEGSDLGLGSDGNETGLGNDAQPHGVFGVDCGVDAGNERGRERGRDAGVESGSDDGSESGIDCGIEAGVDGAYFLPQSDWCSPLPAAPTRAFER